MLNKICTDLESSKRLKELGIEMETQLVWSTGPKGLEVIALPSPAIKGTILRKAYTLEQILEMLPQQIKFQDKLFHFNLEHGSICYDDSLDTKDGGEIIYNFDRYDENLATTACRLLIELIEDGIIKLKEDKII
jgi:hypothetical protein